MEILDIRRAFEKSLKNLDPTFQTAYENDSFEPTKGTPYQSVKLVPDKPENPTFGDLFRRETGTFQIFLCFDSHAGTNAAFEKAGQIQDFYHRGKSLVEGTTEVVILGTPKIAGAMKVDDRYVVPVLIEYYSNINKS